VIYLSFGPTPLLKSLFSDPERFMDFSWFFCSDRLELLKEAFCGFLVNLFFKGLLAAKEALL